MKQRLLSVAIVLIAVYATPTRAETQNVYRCGSNYSQTPCPDGVRVDVQDSRTAEQKAQTDAAVRRDAKTADAMERARLNEEAQREKARAKADAASAKKKPTAKPAAHEKDDGAAPAKPTSTAQAKKKKTKEPEFFTAQGEPPKKPKKAASQPR
jgi:cell division septation protein DedD